MSSTAVSPAKYTAFVCSHTHWDREWYGSFQQFRYRFVRLVDRLMDLLDQDPDFRCFNLDGQTVVLEDYLEVRPEQRDRLERFIREERILIGPWYILPDEWLVSGESTIRNFLRGRQICREFGVEPPNVGYLPDMFGHLSQIPQILQGLGMDNTIFWRGLSGDEWKTELWWEASDGTRVLGVHLPEYCGYCNFAYFFGSLPSETRDTLPADTPGFQVMNSDLDFAVSAVRDIADRAIGLGRTNSLLFMNGIDHMEAQTEVPEIIRLANKLYPDLELRHATFEEFMDSVRESIPDDLQVIKGEQRSTVMARESGAIVLPNILSSRIHLKISNATCQTLLERWVEPFAAAAASLGHAYPEGLIHTAWKMLLRNHPHDSIGGCSIDEVHYQMEARFSEVEDLASVLISTSLNQLCSEIATEDLPEDELPYFLFNPLNWEVNELLTVQIDIGEEWLNARGITVHPDNIYRTLRNLRISEWDGTPVDFHILNIEYLMVHKPWVVRFSPLFMTARITVALAARNLPALGYKGYRIGLPGEKFRRLSNRHGSTNPTVMENKHLRVEILGAGTITLSGQAVGSKTLTGLHYFEDGGDNGDGYTYSPPRHDTVITSRAGRVQVTRLHDEKAIQAVAVDYDLELPASVTPDRQHRSSDRITQRIRSIFRLGPDSKRVDVETTLTNMAKDHRLRVCFDVPGKSDTHFVEMQFDVVERRNRIDQPGEDVWLEDMPLEQPQQGFVSYENLALANFGLPEYELVEGQGENVIKLSLLRAANFLGAGGHANTIVGGAGPFMETPQQQLLGRTYTFRYAIIPHNGNLEKSDVQHQAHQHNALWRGHVSDRHPGRLPASGLSFFDVSGDNIVLSAIKQVENTPGEYVVRAWNAGVKSSKAEFRWHEAPKSVDVASLAEDVVTPTELRANTLSVEIKPKQIMTLRFRR